MLKTTGEELKAFYNDPEIFPEKAYQEDFLVYVNGETFFAEGLVSPNWRNAPISSIPDSADVLIECGYIVYPKETKDVIKLFQDWTKRRNTCRLLVEVPRKEVLTLTAVIEYAGGKVITDPPSKA